MRTTTYTSLLTCICTALAALEGDARPIHRMIRKRLPSPLLKELHLTSEDPSTGKDALSPITDALSIPSTSQYLDQGGLTGSGGFLNNQRLTGPNSMLDDDYVPLGSGGIPISTDSTTYQSVPELNSLVGVVSDSENKATTGAPLNLRRRDGGLLGGGNLLGGSNNLLGNSDNLLDTTNLLGSSSSTTGNLLGSDNVLDILNLEGRLRGMRVKRISAGGILTNMNTNDATDILVELTPIITNSAPTTNSAKFGGLLAGVKRDSR